MKKIVNTILKDAIIDEKAGRDYICTGHDREIFNQMLRKINDSCNTRLHYLAELDELNIPGAGKIIAEYITQFSSESVRAYLIPQLTSDKIKDCDLLLFDMYQHFKMSNDYIAEPGISAPAYIYVRYDNAFKNLRPRRLSADFLSLIKNPRDAYYLPLTTQMTASWKSPLLEGILVAYLKGENITAESVGLSGNPESYHPPFSAISRELKFRALAGLQFYPSKQIIELIEEYTNHSDRDIRQIARKTYKVLKRSQQ